MNSTQRAAEINRQIESLKALTEARLLRRYFERSETAGRHPRRDTVVFDTNADADDQEMALHTLSEAIRN